MKRRNLILAAIAMMASCNSVEPVVEPAIDRFVSNIEPVDTKTALSTGNQICWSEGDQIAIFRCTTVADRFALESSAAGKSSGSFVLVEASKSEAAETLQANVAVYPYSEDYKCSYHAYSGSFRISNVIFPATQEYRMMSFAPNSLVMAAVSDRDDYNLNFRNVGGVLLLKVKGNEKLMSISVKGNSGESIAGPAEIAINPTDQAVSVTMKDSKSRTVTLDCGEGVQLRSQNSEMFYIALPPVEFTNGFTVTLEAESGLTRHFSAIVPNNLGRSKMLVMPEIVFGEIAGQSETVDLSAKGTANCYIVSSAGSYSFLAAKGNTSRTLENIGSCEVLWESFGTDEAPKEGDLIPFLGYKDNRIYFETNPEFREGNAVIAAYDKEGEILWSWHIWMTDMPKDQIYRNGAGTFMDRNLGALSASAGGIGSLGLLYQWGRKDPFLGSSSILKGIVAASTLEWPEAVASDASCGTIEFAVANPTTFVTMNEKNFDWYYTGSSSTNNSRWGAGKTIYDPCPRGWRVPNGGSSGSWAKVCGTSSSISDFAFLNSKKGMDLGGIFGSDASIWFPTAGYRHCQDGNLYGVGVMSISSTTTPGNAMDIMHSMGSSAIVYPCITDYDPAYALSVRCVKE